MLQGILEAFDLRDTTRALQIIDKFDKVGFEVTRDSLKNELELPDTKAIQLLEILNKPVAIDHVENFLLTISFDNEQIKEGKAELLEIARSLKTLSLTTGKVMFNPRIARGLDYYTGSVYETTIDGLEKYGSICSGGRYADLAGKFINRKLPGVGISIGLTRLLDILKHEKPSLFTQATMTDVLIGLENEDQRNEANILADKIRATGSNVEVFHNGSLDLNKQKQYQSKKGIKNFVLLNKDESFEALLKKLV